MNALWISIGIVALIALFFSCYKVFGIDKIESWLLWAVTQAEWEFGSGTGKLKLAKVYDMFIEKFPKLQSIIPYKLFSFLVDKALENMREMLKNNKISKIIHNVEE